MASQRRLQPPLLMRTLLKKGLLLPSDGLQQSGRSLQSREDSARSQMKPSHWFARPTSVTHSLRKCFVFDLQLLFFFWQAQASNLTVTTFVLLCKFSLNHLVGGNKFQNTVTIFPLVCEFCIWVSFGFLFNLSLSI